MSNCVNDTVMLSIGRRGSALGLGWNVMLDRDPPRTATESVQRSGARQNFLACERTEHWLPPEGRLKEGQADLHNALLVCPKKVK